MSLGTVAAMGARVCFAAAGVLQQGIVRVPPAVGVVGTRERRSGRESITRCAAGNLAGMLGRFSELPPRLQEQLLWHFASPAEADRWLHERDPAFGRTPLQLLESPPGLSRLAEMLRAYRQRQADAAEADAARAVVAADAGDA